MTSAKRQRKIKAAPVDPLTLWPLYEFRPLPEIAATCVLRYADGKWIEDDGEYDLAFIYRRNLCLYIELPYQRNIILSWLTGHWTGTIPEHPRGGNPWHYMLREGEVEWGGDWWRDRHPNSRAGKSGMDHACSLYRSASGTPVEFNLKDEHIAAGLVRERGTKQIFTFPENSVCCFCGDKWKARLPKSEAA